MLILQGTEGAGEGAEISLLTDGGIQTDEEDPEQLMNKLSLIGKIIIDKQVSYSGINTLIPV